MPSRGQDETGRSGVGDAAQRDVGVGRQNVHRRLDQPGLGPARGSVGPGSPIVINECLLEPGPPDQAPGDPLLFRETADHLDHLSADQAERAGPLLGVAGQGRLPNQTVEQPVGRLAGRPLRPGLAHPPDGLKAVQVAGTEIGGSPRAGPADRPPG